MAINLRNINVIADMMSDIRYFPVSVLNQSTRYCSELYSNRSSMDIDLRNHERADEINKERRLVEAALEGDYCLMLMLLNSGVSVDAEEYNRQLFYASRNYMTPLQVAAARGHWECVYLLLERGADVDAKDRFDVTAMHMSAEQGHYMCLKALLEANADCSPPTKYSRKGYYTAIPYLGGTTPLHLAAANNRVSCVKELIQYGADYNAVDERGRTGLYIAAQAGYEECVIAQLKNAVGRDILSLPGYETGDTPLHFAVRRGMVESVRELLHLGSDVNHINYSGNSPLHIAVTCGASDPDVAMEILQLLVLNGYNTDINLPDSVDLTALHYVSFSAGAMLLRRPDMAKFLIAYGANVDIGNHRGVTLIEYEYQSTDVDTTILKAIIQALGAPPHPNLLKDISQYTAHLRDMPNAVAPFYTMWLAFRRGMHTGQDMANLHLQFQQNGTVMHRNLLEKQDWYDNIALNPRPLLHYCRYSIRRAMGPKRLRHVKDLPIPCALQAYVLLEGEF